MCAAVLFLGAGIFALGASAFNVLAAEVSGQITSCKITSDKQNIEIALNSSGSTEGTDGKVYVFEQPIYQDDLGSRSDYLASVNASGAATVTVPFSKGNGSDRLYSKFVLAVKEDALTRQSANLIILPILRSQQRIKKLLRNLLQRKV